MPVNIPETDKKRVVIVGAGFAGLTLARKLCKKDFQVVLLDRNNYHQFQPLFYQVAMAGLEPSSIAFPLRKTFQGRKNIHIRVVEVTELRPEQKQLMTSQGYVNYDILVLAYGATTNYFGNKNIEKYALPLKSLSEALELRNFILDDLEKALTTREYEQRQKYIDIAVVGGGPTGVEMAGALAEMKKYILPKDYSELESSEVDIYLIQGGDRLLKGMSEQASEYALKRLEKLGVRVKLNTRVVDYDGSSIRTKDGEHILANKVIWAAGISCAKLIGMPEESYTWGNRLKVSPQLEVEGVEDVFAIGDLSYLEEGAFDKGHPQVAQVAIQQGKFLFKQISDPTFNGSFAYQDKGSMATIGRNNAVVDLKSMKLQGFFAWFMWLIVHLAAILGVKNKLFVLINWMWNYLTYDQSLRLIIRTNRKNPSSTS